MNQDLWVGSEFASGSNLRFASVSGLFRWPVLVVVVDENLHIWVNRSQGGAQMQRNKFSFFLGGAWIAGSLWFPTVCNEFLVNASRVSTQQVDLRVQWAYQIYQGQGQASLAV